MRMSRFPAVASGCVVGLLYCFGFTPSVYGQAPVTISVPCDPLGFEYVIAVTNGAPGTMYLPKNVSKIDCTLILECVKPGGKAGNFQRVGVSLILGKTGQQQASFSCGPDAGELVVAYGGGSGAAGDGILSFIP